MIHTGDDAACGGPSTKLEAPFCRYCDDDIVEVVWPKKGKQQIVVAEPADLLYGRSGRSLTICNTDVQEGVLSKAIH